MLFNSYVFIFVFLPVTLVGFYLCARIHFRAAVGLLVLASLIYYGWWSPPYVLLILFSILFNFTLGVTLSDASRSARFRKGALIAGVAVVEVYDFTGYNIYTAEPIPLDEPTRSMRWCWEVSHFRRELGDIVLDMALGGAEPPLGARGSSFGVRINAANIDEHLTLIRHERARWAPSARDEIGWLAKTLGIKDVDRAPSD